LDSINDIPEKRQTNFITTIGKKLTKDEVPDTEDFVSKQPYTKEEQLNFIESKDLSKQAYTKEEQLNFIESKDLLPENNVKNSEDSKIKKKIQLNSTSSKSETISNKEKQLDGKLLETCSNYANQATPLKSDNSNTKIKKTSKSSKILKKKKK